MDGQLDVHVVSQLEQKFEKTRFVRVDSDVIDKIIVKDEVSQVNLSDEQRAQLLKVANACPMHKLLTGEVRIQTELTS